MDAKAYSKYQTQTWAVHRRAINAVLQHYTHTHPVLDLGCGQTPLTKRLLNPACYIGVDKEATDPSVDFNTKTGQVKICSLLHEFDIQLVTSTFATEVFMQPAARKKLYESIFAASPKVERIMVSGVCYPKQPRAQRKTKPFPHYISEPFPRASEWWTEQIYVQTVESDMFGNETEVWRVMRRCKWV